MATASPKPPAAKKTVSKPAKDESVVSKPTESKTPAVKKAVAKKAAPIKKPEPAKKPAVKKAAVVSRKVVSAIIVVSDEERYRMIAEAAYYRAESQQFRSDPIRDWIEAERDITILLNGAE